MTDRQFNTIFSAALADDDREAFVSDWALSIIWGEDEAATGGELAERAALIGRIWDIAHLTVADIRRHLGLSQSEFALRYCIPYRTVTNWEGRDSAPAYVVLLLARAAGMTKGVLQ